MLSDKLLTLDEHMTIGGLDPLQPTLPNASDVILPWYTGFQRHQLASLLPCHVVSKSG